MNRRHALAAGVGVAAGSLWVGGLGLLLKHHDPTLEVTGSGHDLMALLDTGSFRALVVAGDGLPENLGSLMGVFRRRIDLAVGSMAGLAAIGVDGMARLGAARSLVLDVAPGIRSFPVANEKTGPPILVVHSPSGVTLTIITDIHGAWNSDEQATQNWLIVAERHGHRCAIASAPFMFQQAGEGGMGVGIVAGGFDEKQWDMLRMNLSAIAATTPMSPGPGPQTIRLFPNHPLILTFRSDGIAIAE